VILASLTDFEDAVEQAEARHKTVTRTANAARREAVLEQLLLLDVIAALETPYIYIGPRLGLSTLESAPLAGLQLGNFQCRGPHPPVTVIPIRMRYRPGRRLEQNCSTNPVHSTT